MKKIALACALSALMTSSALSQSAEPLRIGVLTDLTSWGRDNSGPGSVEAAKMAVEEFGPTVLGRKIEIMSADHQMKPDVGMSVARSWIERDNVAAIVDVPNSAIGIAIHNLAKEKNKIALLSGAGSSAITDELCSPNTVHFTYDTYALAKVTGAAIAKEGGKNWFFITADYAFGHQLERDAGTVLHVAQCRVGPVGLLVGQKHADHTTDDDQAKQHGDHQLHQAQAGLAGETERGASVHRRVLRVKALRRASASPYGTVTKPGV